jgi:hydrogenase/urease accessory protein HupE
VLPLLGLSGAAIFLAQYKVPFMVVGIVSNVVGIGVMLRLIRRMQRGVTSPPVVEAPACHVGDRLAEGGAE